jgi:hypothetical protein
MNYTDSIDFDLILSGSVELILDDGSQCSGQAIAWLSPGTPRLASRPHGCQLTVVVLGAPPLP